MYKGQAETCCSFSLTVLICDRSTQINYIIVRICITIVIQRKAKLVVTPSEGDSFEFLITMTVVATSQVKSTLNKTFRSQ